MSQDIDTRVPGPPAMTRFEAATMRRKPAPASESPMANLVGLERSRPRVPSASQIDASTGANRMTHADSADWNHDVGISHPPTMRLVKSRAKRLSDVGCCSNADQKTTEKMKSTSTTTMRRRSSASSPAKKNRYMKQSS